MIFPENMELINHQGMNERNIVQDGEHNAANVYNNSADVYNQKMKMLQKQTAFSTLQIPQAPEQNGVLLSPKELGSQVPCDLHAHHHLIQTRMTHLVGAFSARAQLFLSKLQRPPTPTQSSTSISSSNAVSSQNLRAKRTGSAHPVGETTCIDCMTCTKTLDPQTISPPDAPLNDSSKDELNVNMMTPTWLTLDVFADMVYLLDVIFVQPRVSFLTEHGIWAQEMTTTVQSYTKGRRSKLDIIALLPLDIIFYFVDGGKDHAYLRLPRFLKAGSFRDMCEKLDVALASPHVVRIARTVASMLYLVHLHACFYYLFSTWEGIASNGWVFSGKGNAYIRCFYFATKTSTSIGKNPKPVNEAEYLFMTWSWLSGVFIFAMLIGQIKDIVATASKTRSEFQRLLDETIHYMRRIHLPENTQKRVFQWLTHTWEHQQVLDELEVLEWLPSKLRGDVALDVHEGSLSKVHLFRHCGHQLLRQLVLKLRPVLYLPGDYVCRKGEVGKEMYIIKAGIVEVVGAKKTGDGGEGFEVLATLTEGSVFGEISLLDIGGGNKRTADVRSKGFATLFVLSKADLREALEHHPEAKQVLKEKASQLMRENADREKKMKMEEKEVDMVIIKPDPNRPPTPKLIDTVIQAVGTNSKAAQLLMYGSKAVTWENNDSAVGHADQTCNVVTVNREPIGNPIPWTEPREHGVFGDVNPLPNVDEVARPARSAWGGP
ncbi:cyclic nucleotide-gated channel beta-3 isoform X2 [Hetaerina americana]|uniref:cyclic nucleotide-gated channel beta-3 isoform X2 n=1 Tax=Hetaerina americana TaxID=62018 RepID=UPI003A7F114E